MAEKLSTGIEGFDTVTFGGVLKGNQYLIIGAPGTGKTVFSVLFGLAGIKNNENVLFITVEETAPSLKRHMASLSLDISDFKLIDATPARDSNIWILKPQDESKMNRLQSYIDVELNLDNLISIINEANKKTPLSRVIIDSMTSLLSFYETEVDIRRASTRFLNFLRELGVTTFLTAESGDIDKSRIIKHLCDGVIELSGNKPNRVFLIKKLRGQEYIPGPHTYKILSGVGVSLYPHFSLFETYDIGTRKEISSPAKFGLPFIDELLGNGLTRNTVTLLAGNSGTGKTIMSLKFLITGIRNGERGVYITLESDMDKIFSLMENLKVPLAEYSSQGLSLLSIDPNYFDLNELMFIIAKSLKEIGATRFVLDGLRVLELMHEISEVNNFLYSLAKMLHRNLITSIITREIPDVAGTLRFTEGGISYNFDNIILLRYLESREQLVRTIAIYKALKKYNPIIYRYEIVPERLFQFKGRGIDIDSGKK